MDMVRCINFLWVALAKGSFVDPNTRFLLSQHMNAPNHAISGSRLVARALMANVERPVVAGIPVCRPRLLSGRIIACIKDPVVIEKILTHPRTAIQSPNTVCLDKTMQILSTPFHPLFFLG